MTGRVKKSTNSPMLQLPSTSVSTNMPGNCSFGSTSQEYDASIVRNSPLFNGVHPAYPSNPQLWNWPNTNLCANYFESAHNNRLDPPFLKGEDVEACQMDNNKFMHNNGDRNLSARWSSEGKARNLKSSLRRYKTPSPQLLRVRREAANARERRRMNHLNVAFEQLRTVLPEMDNGRRLSKFETLQMAQQYIDCLNELLCRNSR